jgi:hypothetical protein
MSRIHHRHPPSQTDSQEEMTKPLRVRSGGDGFQARPAQNRQTLGRMRGMGERSRMGEMQRGGRAAPMTKPPSPMNELGRSTFAQQRRPPVDLLGGLQNLVSRNLNEWFGARHNGLPKPGIDRPLVTDPSQTPVVPWVDTGTSCQGPDAVGVLGSGTSSVGSVDPAQFLTMPAPAQPAPQPEAPSQNVDVPFGYDP